MRIFAIIVLTLIFMGALGAPWRMGLFPLYKGLTGALTWAIHVICAVAIFLVSLWLAQLIVNWIGIS